MGRNEQERSFYPQERLLPLEKVPSFDFKEFINEPVDSQGRSLLEQIKQPPVLRLLSRVNNPELAKIISESFNSLPIKIGITEDNLPLFRKARLKNRIKEGRVLTASGLEGRLPPVVIDNLRAMALGKKVRRGKSVFSQRESLEFYLGWTELWFDYLSGKTIEEISSNLGISPRKVGDRLKGILPRELSYLTLRRKRKRGPEGGPDVSNELAVILGIALFRGKYSIQQPGFLEKLGIDRKSMGIEFLTLLKLSVLVEERKEKFLFALGTEERSLVIKRILTLFGKEENGKILLSQTGDKGMVLLRQIQEHLAGYGIYSTISFGKKKPEEVNERLRLVIPGLQSEGLKKWLVEGKRADGVDEWGGIYFSRLYSYNQEHFLNEDFRRDRRFLREQREKGLKVPAKSTLERWRKGDMSIPQRLRCFFDVYGFREAVEGKETTLAACRFYLRRGEKVVHRLKEKFPQKGLHELTKIFLLVDSLFYQMPEEIEAAVNQWNYLLESDDLGKLFELDLLKREPSHEQITGEIFVQGKLSQGEVVNLSTIPIDDSVVLYKKEIGGVPLLTSQEEVVLAKWIEKGGLASGLLRIGGESSHPVVVKLKKISQRGWEAKEQFIKANTRLVTTIAQKYIGMGVPLIDLIQEGNIGLMTAVEKFDWRRGCKFSTSATRWIKQKIRRAINEQGRTIRVPIHQSTEIGKMFGAKGRLTKELKREPSEEELTSELKISSERLRKMQRWASQEPISLEMKVGRGDSELIDFIADENALLPGKSVDITSLGEKIEEVLATLSSREAKILRLRVGLIDGKTYTLEEVGEKFGLTRERIRQIEGEALRKLRHPISTRLLKDFI